MSRDERLDELLRQTLRARDERAQCPPEGVWLDLVEGRIEGAEAEALRTHLTACATCAGTARDAHRFAAAFAGAERRSTRPAWLPRALAAAAVLAVAVAALVLLSGRTGTPRSRAVERLAASLDVPAPEPEATAPSDAELAYRGAAPDELAASLDAALAPYRERRYAPACAAPAAHARRFPADRTGRYYAAVACLEAGELERADELLAGLAANAGERRDEAHQLLERLRRARDEDSR